MTDIYTSICHLISNIGKKSLG